MGESIELIWRYKTKLSLYIAQVRQRTGRNYSCSIEPNRRAKITYEGPMSHWSPVRANAYKQLRALRKAGTIEEGQLEELSSLEGLYKELKKRDVANE